MAEWQAVMSTTLDVGQQHPAQLAAAHAAADFHFPGWTFEFAATEIQQLACMVVMIPVSLSRRMRQASHHQGEMRQPQQGVGEGGTNARRLDASQQCHASTRLSCPSS
jgi:hypothetical protein